ncbi:DUF6364 family protein [Psychrobacter sp. I-STPA10]|uniref:DUF6364 family protein n=1 Tax=Psychrobacter sp. I-STPA10 TaxID=2585769 RepID=UPI001E55D1CA|nr:DUF6364 family protein [Psychrobacter sp. I-STPA10]
MTTITMDLPDELIEKAKQQGVFNEQDLSNVLKDFLASQLEQEQPVIPRRMGTLKGKITVPDDFDTAYADEIAELFGCK